MRMIYPARSFVLAGAALAAACSHSGGNGAKSSPAPNPVEQDPVYLLDGSGMNPKGQELSFEGKPVLWTARAVVDSNEAMNLAKTTFAAVKAGLQNVKVKATQDVQLEFTLIGTGSDGKDLLLATNVEATAEAAPAAKALWDKSCSDVTTDFDVLGGVNVETDATSGGASVDMKLCDFQNILVSPTVSITPANVTQDIRNIVYECDSNNDVTMSIYYADYPFYAACKAGYDLPPAGAGGKAQVDHDNYTGIKFDAPAGLDTNFKFYWANGFLDATGLPDPTKKYTLAVENAKPDTYGLPVGNFADCHTIEVRLRYQDNPGPSAAPKDARVSFHRVVDPVDGSETWKTYDQTALPPPQMVANQRDSTFRWYLFCTWENQDGMAVSQIDPTGN